MTFRTLLLWTHLVLGLTGAVFLALAGGTAAFITAQPLLALAINPMPRVEWPAEGADFLAMAARIEQEFAPATVRTLQQRLRGRAAEAVLSDGTTVLADPRSGEVLGSRPARFASFRNLSTLMRRLHTDLVLGERGALVVVLATLEGLVLSLTGLWLWWKKKTWRFSMAGSLYKASWTLHSATGVWFLVPLVAMMCTGVVMGKPGLVTRITGEPESPYQYPPLVDAPAGEVPRVPLSRVLSVADSVVPGAVPLGLTLPAGPRNAAAVRTADATIYVNPYDGTVAAVHRSPAPNSTDAAITFMERVHTGEQFGWPGELVMAVASLMLAFMAGTGVVLGWKRLVITARVAGRRRSARGVT